MRKPLFSDVVRLNDPVMDWGENDAGCDVTVPEGDLGTIIEEFDTHDEAYEAEFSDDDGQTWATMTVRRDQFEVVHPKGKRVPERVGA